MISYELINKQNLIIAIDIQKTIFPDEDGAQDLIDSMNNTPPDYQFMQKHWIAYSNKLPIGIVGLYAYKDYPKDAWLGWYGVVENYRRLGYGKQLFKFAQKQAQICGFENLRLYTDEQDNCVATKLYEKLGMIKEKYENKSDKYYTASQVLIYSLSLTDKICKKWNNRNLSLGKHENHNKKGE